MKVFLIIFMTFNQNAGITTSTIPFSSMGACMTAGKVLNSEFEKSRHLDYQGRSRMIAVCAEEE